MAVSLPWPAIGSFVAGVISVFFLGYLWPYREEKGAKLFMGVIGCVTLWTVSYGVALLVFDPSLRFAFEIPIWLGITFSSVFFLAFALEYTGRTRAVRSQLMAGAVGLQLAATAVVATNPMHGLVWTEYEVVEVAGVAGVATTNAPLLYMILLVTTLLTTGGIVLLVDAFASYGPLYRYQTIAIALSPVPIMAGLLMWVFEVGPIPELNLAPLLFPLHLALDMYAFFRRNMFELTPAARRAGDQTAIDDLGIGVLIVDDDEQIININREAIVVLGQEKRDTLGEQLDDVWPEIDLSEPSQRVRHQVDHQHREYAVSVSAIMDSGGNPVGHTVALQDITTERQREQRLAVLNRILRHNLRNDLNVASGYLDIVAEEVDDEAREMLSVASRNVEGVLELGEKARTVERTLESNDLGTEPVEARALIDEVTATVTEDHGGRADNQVPAELVIETNPKLLESLFANLVENALEHNEDDEAVVTVTAGVDGEMARFEITDNGPGIPNHELTVIEEGTETDLEHGSGIGLWIVKWASTALGGSVEFETGPNGTTVTVTLPNVVGTVADDKADSADEQPPVATD